MDYSVAVMSLELTYDERLMIVKVRGVDQITLDDIERVTLQLLHADEYPDDVNSLWDLRELKFHNIDMEFIKGIISLRKKYNTKRGEAKIAIVDGSELSRPLIKLYAILSSALSQKTKLFDTVEEAELWLCDDFLKRKVS